MNKKGQAEAIITIASLLFIALILIVFAVFFGLVRPSSEVNINAVSGDNKVDIMLLNFVNSKGVSEAIINKDYDFVQIKMNDLLIPIISNIEGARVSDIVLKIEDNEEKCLSTNGKCALTGYQDSANLIVPGKERDIVVNLYVGFYAGGTR